MRTLILVSILTASTLEAGNEIVADQIWSEREIRVLTSLQLSNVVVEPADSPSNRVANNAVAASFGRDLFFDKRMSKTGEIACASCHQPEKHFTDGLPRSVGIATTGRNAPTVVGSSHNAWFYWDGRRDSLWSQALVPFESPAEMASSRLSVVRIVGSDIAYRNLYEGLFGAFPDALLESSLPLRAGPIGDSVVREEWRQISARDKAKINHVYANIGKCIDAFERTLQPTPSRFDRYIATLLAEGENKASNLLTDDEMKGAKLFMDSDRTQCLQCHNGAFFSNGGFHNIGTGIFSGDNIDLGRVFGLRAVLLDEFNCLGPYSDSKPEECMELRFLNKDSHVPLEGAFKVPGLRDLKKTAPYFHDGRFESLREVIDHYIAIPGVEQPTPHELRPLVLNEAEVLQLLAFLNALSD